ncbi:hypothetical protein AB0G46_25190, partial [Streptomyces sp. NPDC020667]
APPEPPRRRRGPVHGCAVWAALFCTCQICCTDYHDPWNGKKRDAWCDDCDCPDCSGCDGCGDCCNCCDCCGNCDCCDCGCDC